MLAAPILIRRPLLEVDGRRRAGFDADNLEAWLGLVVDKTLTDLETCPKGQDKQACKS